MIADFDLRHISLLILIVLGLTACGQANNHQDLQTFISTVKSKPAGRIEPIPIYPPYESFVYASASKRSPFDRPIDIQRRVFTKSQASVRPDFNRAKEFLEGFDVSSLAMVGTIKRGNSLWALVRDSSGGIHRVATGNYLGRNHGRVTSVDNTKVELIEIVSDGLDGWVERPRLLALVEKG